MRLWSELKLALTNSFSPFLLTRFFINLDVLDLPESQRSTLGKKKLFLCFLSNLEPNPGTGKFDKIESC